MSELGRLDVMANIAGIIVQAPVVDFDDDALDRILAVNLIGVFRGCRAAARVMSAQGSGSIVNMASAAIDTPSPGLAGYGMAKAAVVQLTRVLATEMGPLGVRVNAVAPGFVETAMTEPALHRRRRHRRRDPSPGRARRRGPLHPAAHRGPARGHRPRRAVPGLGRVAFRHRADPPPQRGRGHAVVSDGAMVSEGGMASEGAVVRGPCEVVMQVVVDVGAEPATVVLEEPADCGRFHVAVRGGGDAGALDGALRANAAGVASTATARPWSTWTPCGAWRSGSVGETWEADFGAMLGYARVQGLAERGRRHRSGRTWSGGSFAGGGDPVTATRTETDSMGPIEVPADRYWGPRRPARSCTSPSATTSCRAR